MTPDEAARIIQKAWFEWKSWCVAQDCEYSETNYYYPDDEIEYLF